MKRGARDSQVVNNFFTFATIIIVSVVLTLYTKYFSNDKNIVKKSVEKIQCEKEIPTKVKIFNERLLKKSIKAIDKGYYKLEGSFLKALKDSTIENIITLDELDKYYISTLGIKPKKGIEKYLKIRYELIENEKNKKENIFAGALKTSFRINSNEILVIYTNLAFLYNNAIKKRVDCSIKVYKNHVYNSTK